VKGVVDSGQLGIFTNGYWGHPAMRLSPEVNLLAVSHYLQALEYQRKANQASRSSARRRPTSRTWPWAASPTRSTWTTRPR
jgi:Ni,Fe-hydrogenase I large subunit